MGSELRYLRICPQCRHENPEQANRCQQCGLFIGMEPAILVKSNDNTLKSEPVSPQLIPKLAQETEKKHISTPIADMLADFDGWDAAPNDLPLVQLATNDATRVELECLGYPTVLYVPAGATIGQEHAEQGADVPVPKTVAESVYLHRRHCRIDRDQGRWWLTAINQAIFGRDFTNPTAINDSLLVPGEKRELREGDLVRLSGLRLQVKRLP